MGSALHMTDKKVSKLPMLLIFLTVFIDLIGFGIIIPLLPLYAEQFGANGLTVGLLLMSYSLMQFIFTPFWGRLSDNIGRRPVLLISLTASAIGYLIWGFSGSLTMLFVSRIVAGFGNANLAVAQAYIADITTPENRAKGMGLVGAAFGLGFVLGPAIGGICSHFHMGANTVGFVAAGFSALDLILTAAKLPEPPNRSQAGHDRFRPDPGFYLRTVTDSKLAVPMLIFLISTFAFSNMEATLVLLTQQYFHYGMAENSWMFTYVGFLMVMVQGGMIGRLSKKYGEKPLVTAGTALVALGLLLTPATHSIAFLYVALALLAIGTGINTPSNQSILSKLADPDKVGGVMGVGQSMATLGRILGPVAGGFMFDKFGAQSPYLVGAVAMGVAFALSLSLPKTKQAAEPPKPQPAPDSKVESEQLV
jgi:DHA1 family tetracycline resistance protein-like MFS transporter